MSNTTAVQSEGRTDREADAPPRVLVGAPAKRKTARSVAPAGGKPAWLPLFVVGLGLAIVGLVDVALVWFPPNLGNAEWEFGAITRTFNGLALATLGLGAVSVYAATLGGRVLNALTAAVNGLLALAVLGATGLYALVVPVAIGGAPDALRDSLLVAIGKTTIYALVYLAIYAFLTVYCIRRFNSIRRERLG